MKAVVAEQGSTPTLVNWEPPQPQAEECLIDVAAVGISPVTRAVAAGTHYLSAPQSGSVVGIDGVGRTPDGRRIYFDGLRPPSGSLAEQVAVGSGSLLELPDSLADDQAAAIFNLPCRGGWR